MRHVQSFQALISWSQLLNTGVFDAPALCTNNNNTVCGRPPRYREQRPIPGVLDTM